MGKDSENKIYWFECVKNYDVFIYTYPLAYSESEFWFTAKPGDIIGLQKYNCKIFKTDKNIIYLNFIEYFKDYSKRLSSDPVISGFMSKSWIDVSDKINRDLKLKNIIDENIDI